MNNPLYYTDPSGHWVCESATECKFPSELPYPSGTIPPDNLPKTMPAGLRDGPPDNPGGVQAYQGLLALQGVENAWWGSELNAHEAIMILLNQEFGNLYGADLSEPSDIPAAALEAASNKYQIHCGGGPWSAACLSGFWAYSQPITDAAYDQGYRQSVRDHRRYDNPNIMAYLGGKARQIEDMNFPGSSLPTQWATILDDETATLYYSFVVDQGTGAAAGQSVYWAYAYWGESGLDALFVVLTDAQYTGTLR